MQGAIFENTVTQKRVFVQEVSPEKPIEQSVQELLDSHPEIVRVEAMSTFVTAKQLGGVVQMNGSAQVVPVLNVLLICAVSIPMAEA